MAQRGMPVSAAAASFVHDRAIFRRTYADLHAGDLRGVANAMDLGRADATSGVGRVRLRPIEPVGAPGNRGYKTRSKSAARGKRDPHQKSGGVDVSRKTMLKVLMRPGPLRHPCGRARSEQCDGT